MSADGSTFLFATAAEQLLHPGLRQAPLPSLRHRSGAEELPPRWLQPPLGEKRRSRDDDAGVGVGRQQRLRNKATLASAVLPGARDVLSNISDTGRFVLFSSASNNLVAGINDPGFKGGSSSAT
jgi:hypothetical protein